MGGQELIAPFVISLQVAIFSTILTTVIGVVIAFFTYQEKKRFFLIDTIVTLPMILPPTVIGFFLLQFFGKHSIIGISMVFTIYGAILAAFLVSLPLVYKMVKATFQQIDVDILNSARSLGLSETKIFFYIMLPISKKGIIAGAMLSFARALGEFGATMMIAGNIPGKTQTISVKIYALIQAGNYEEAYLYVWIMVGISFVFVVLLNMVSKQKFL